MSKLRPSNPTRTQAIHADRRARLIESMERSGGGVAIIPTAVEHPRNGDNDFPFRYDSSFHYLTGLDEPQALLVLHSTGRSVVFCRPRSPENEIWEGHRIGVDAAAEVLGVDEAHPIGQLDALMPKLLANRAAVWFGFGAHPGLASRIEGWLDIVRVRERQGLDAPALLRDLNPLLGEMRLVKDEQEQETMRRAAAISAEAHVRAMRFCASRLGAGSSVREYEIEAELLHEFRRHGSQSPAYPSIVAAGANACVLHYPAGNAELLSGDLCLIDAGCELDGYASDVTRTFPASGRYSSPQRALYDIVLAAQEAAIAATVPGRRHVDAHAAAVRVLSQGMLDCGLLDSAKVGDVDAVIETAAYRRFYMHGTGHWIGRDVHDVGSYLSPDEAPFEQSDWLGGRVVKRPTRHLVPGMALTIEPGLYVRPAEDVPEKYWNIGIRIEDDVIVTPEGCELITRGAPVKAEEIEALMRG